MPPTASSSAASRRGAVWEGSSRRIGAQTRARVIRTVAHRRPAAGRSGAGARVEVVRRDQAVLEGQLDETGALAVLREIFDPEPPEERAHVRLDRLSRDEELLRDLLVGRRRCERAGVAERAAQ